MQDVIRKNGQYITDLKNRLSYIITLETKSSRILPLTWVIKYDMI